MFDLKKIKAIRDKRREYFRDKWRNEIKSIVKEAMDEWTEDCEYLTKKTDKE
tara:strand:+ start:1714 stop:1869 length:156 start_codon:yes stop_codon:yes gene_type:complete